MNRKDRRGNKTTYLSGNTGIRLICEAVAVELLFYAILCVSETGGRTCEKPDVFGDNFAGIAGTCG